MEILIIFYHEPMSIGDAIFASTLTMTIAILIVSLLRLLFDHDEEEDE